MGSEEPKIEKLAPGVSRAVEPESPAALAMKRAMEKRKGAAVPKGVPGSGPTDEEMRAKKAAYQKAYWARRKAKESKSGETPPRKKYARRGPKKLEPRTVVHVAAASERIQDVPAEGLIQMITEGHRLMDRIERLFGKGR